MLENHLALHYHIIYISFNILIQLCLKHLSHHPLIGRPRIFQAKGHHLVIVVSNRNNKSCLFLSKVSDGTLERHSKSSSEDGL